MTVARAAGWLAGKGPVAVIDLPLYGTRGRFGPRTAFSAVIRRSLFGGLWA